MFEIIVIAIVTILTITIAKEMSRITDETALEKYANKQPTEQQMDRAMLAAFIAYQQSADIHPEEKGMSSHMFEAGWNACLKYLKSTGA